jgi:hypothetical protein
MKRTAIIALMALVIAMPLFAGCGIPKDVQGELDQLRADKQQWEEVDKPALEQEITELKKLPLIAPSSQDPTYSDLMDWIARDQTNTLTFTPMGYYATTLFAFARTAGIKSYLIRITIVGPPQQYWYFTAFNTTDKGLIYILPSEDREIALIVGKKVHELVGGPVYVEDDTILKIESFE